MIKDIIKSIEETFGEAAHPIEGQAMKTYLKNKFNCLGIKSPQRNELQKPYYPAIKKLNPDQQLEICKTLWGLDGREYQYFAIELLRRHFKKASPSFLDEIQYFIITKSWWDTVDSLASNCVGSLIQTNPDLVDQMDLWINDDNMWLRRSALIFQLKYGEKTDSDRLFHYCTLRMHEKDFFIRKAIGWALRQYSRFDPQAVMAFVREHENTLSELSKKEALRLIK